MVRKVTKIVGNNALITMQPKLRVAAYCRVSTDSDEQLVSLEAQRTHYEAYIKANPNWEFSGIYYDEGISGTKKEKRTELLRLLADCENKRIDFIVTKSISRFARNTTDCLEIVRRLNEIGVSIYFEKENINTQSMDSELMLTILSSLAENESVSISQNNKWSIKRKFQNGTYKLSSPPYGYDYADGQLHVNAEQAEVVRRIFSEALSGSGTKKIANGLNAEGIPPQRGDLWTSTSIRGILGNEKYTGDAIFQKTYTDKYFNKRYNNGEKDQYYIQNHHEAIISREDFEAVNEALLQRAKEKGIEIGTAKYQNRYLFSSRIKCSECGSTFKRRVHHGVPNKYIAWCCSKHLNDISACSMKFIREDSIHQAFITMINKLIFGRKWVLKPIIDSLKAASPADNRRRLKELEAKLEENAERRCALSNLAGKQYLDSSVFSSWQKELINDAVKLKDERENLIHFEQDVMTKMSEVAKLMRYVSKPENELDSFNEELFKTFVEEIDVISQTEIAFKLKCGLTLKERLVR